MWKLYFKSNLSIRLTYWHRYPFIGLFYVVKVYIYLRTKKFGHSYISASYLGSQKSLNDDVAIWNAWRTFWVTEKMVFSIGKKKPMYYSSTNPYFLIGLFLLNWTKKDLGRTHKYKGNDPILHSRKICLDAKTLSSQNSIWCISTFYIK